MVAVDFLIVPTIRFRMIYVFVILSHSRREVIHFNVTEYPTAEWTAQQVIEAFPWDTAPRFLLRDDWGSHIIICTAETECSAIALRVQR